MPLQKLEGDWDKLTLARTSGIITEDTSVSYWPIFSLSLSSKSPENSLQKLNSLQFTSCVYTIVVIFFILGLQIILFSSVVDLLTWSLNALTYSSMYDLFSWQNLCDKRQEFERVEFKIINNVKWFMSYDYCFIRTK